MSNFSTSLRSKCCPVQWIADLSCLLCCQVRTLVQQDYGKALESVDALISPVSPVAAWKFGEKVSDPLAMYAADIMTINVNLAGLPAIVVPCGYDNEKPVGIQVRV